MCGVSFTYCLMCSVSFRYAYVVFMYMLGVCRCEIGDIGMDVFMYVGVVYVPCWCPMMVSGVSGISAVFAHKVVLGLGVGSARVADIRIALSGVSVSELVFGIGSWLEVRYHR